MNEFLPSRFVENVRHLALGLEPIDAERGTRIAHPMRVVFDEEMEGLRRPEVTRHDSCRHVLLYSPGLADQVQLRFFEDDRQFVPRVVPRRFAGDWGSQIRGGTRRFVPRRIRFPILTQSDAEQGSHELRVRRPFMFPGAAYDVAAGMTGLRGRVERDGLVVRWARITATLLDGETLVGRAHGDDRGEFLLVVSTAAGAIGELADPLTVRIRVSAPATNPLPVDADEPIRDPLWDLPVEVAAALDPGNPELDDVSRGMALPSGYTATVIREVDLRLGRIESATTAISFP